MSLNIQYLELKDKNIFKEDKHISSAMLEQKIKNKEIIVVKKEDRIIAWLRWGYFWDNIPFVNLLYAQKSFRNQGIGKQILDFWENEMRKKDYKLIMTSSLSNEEAQFFYKKLGYQECGSLIMPKEPLEILFLKELS